MQFPSHHPEDAMLLGYAAGAADTSLDLVVVTHLALCPRCRRIVEAFEHIGGTLLGETAPAALPPDALDHVLARIAAPAVRDSAGSQRAPRGGDPRIPEPLRSILGPLDEVPWIAVGGTRVVGLPAIGPDARLAVLPPGFAVPFHTHRGRELLLVVTGAFEDGHARFVRGDVSVADEAMQHDMRILPGDDCIALVVRDAPVHEVLGDGSRGPVIPGY